MEIRQSGKSARVRYVFAEHELHYTFEDDTGSRSLSLPYTDIGRHRPALVARDRWLRDVSLLWIALGLAVTAVTWFGHHTVHLSAWVLLGCVGLAGCSLPRTRFTALPTEHGDLVLVDDAQAPRIVEQIAARRAAHLLQEYDFVDPREDSAHRSRRLAWLHGEGALSEDELRERLAMLQRPEHASLPPTASGHLLLE